jgi:hypothetical protein
VNNQNILTSTIELMFFAHNHQVVAPFSHQDEDRVVRGERDDPSLHLCAITVGNNLYDGGMSVSFEPTLFDFRDTRRLPKRMDGCIA